MRTRDSESLLAFLCFVLVFFLFMTACAHRKTPVDPGHVKPFSEKRVQQDFFPSDKYEPKVNNFVVLLDTSSSMSAMVEGSAKIDTAKQFVSRMIGVLPELSFNSALISFGHNPIVTLKPAIYRYKTGVYDRSRFLKALNEIRHTGGYSNISAALKLVDEDLATLHGDTALILVSDGMIPVSLTVKILRSMKKKYRTGLCIYPVMIGDDPSGMGAMNKFAWLGECGFAVKASDIKTDRAMLDYVEKVFFTKVVLRDSDEDGVYDRYDQCPNTPKGAVVDKRGCWVVEDVAFEFDRWNIRPEYYPVLDRMAGVFEKNPELKVELQGYTDNIGTDAYNLRLSKKRAESVMNYFIKKGIARDRMYVIGYGAQRPIADNATAEGRAKNRRVELKPVYLVPAGR